MRLTNEWWYFTSVLDEKTCGKIKELIKTKRFKEAGVGAKAQEPHSEEDKLRGNITRCDKPTEFNKNPPILNKDVRITDVSWSSDEWLYDIVWPYMEGANKSAGWNFDILGAESMQIGKYKEGAFYNWHKDGGSDSFSAYDNPANPFVDGRVRKLSMTVLLNEDYEGGELQFCSYGNEGSNISTPAFDKAGSIVVFPSFMEHRVSPVTKGTRYSLVVWFVGPPFK